MKETRPILTMKELAEQEADLIISIWKNNGLRCKQVLGELRPCWGGNGAHSWGKIRKILIFEIVINERKRK
jgi:hypothetical protein